MTRRDFLDAAALGAGAALLAQSAPLVAATPARSPEAAAFDGYSGVGDYANANGNTWSVLQNAHAMRDGAFRELKDVIDTGELYDVVVVGGGIAGLGAAHRVMQLSAGRKSCLVLENHPLWGGESKRNEFLIGNVRLMAPQGANYCSMRNHDASPIKAEVWADLGLPREFHYSELGAARKPLEVPRNNYIYQLWGDTFESHGFYFPEQKRWVTNPWGHDLEGVPWPDDVKRDMRRWRHDPKRYYAGPDGLAMERWLDSMTYEQYLTGVMGLRTEVARYVDPILASAGGLGSDVISAYMAWGFTMPGFQTLNAEHPAQGNYTLKSQDYDAHRFPGGNDAIARAFVKRLVPEAIAGGPGFIDYHNGAAHLEALDRPDQATRIRLAATTVAVAHEGARDSSERVAVVYRRDGRLFRVRARGVVVASGSWSAKHVVRDLTSDYREAMNRFHRAPMLIINVALTNWRALYKLGYTAASWRGGQLGFSFNLTVPMQVGAHTPPFDPDKPAVLTYYVPFSKPGLSVEQQGPAGRAELLSTSYRDYERAIRAQLTEMLSAQGFNARRDIAAIVLNRWGHAYVNPYPGFYFGSPGTPAPRDVVRAPRGRIAFGHSELRGHQSWHGAVTEGRRAAEQILELI